MDQILRMGDDFDAGKSIVKSAVAAVDPTLGAAFEAIDTATSVFRGLAERRVRVWWRYIIDDASDERAERAFEYEIDEKRAAVLLDTLRSAMSAVDEAALPGLGRLARLYTRDAAGKRDKFFRSCTRLLIDASAEELESIAALVVWMLNAVNRDGFTATQRGPNVSMVLDAFAKTAEEESENTAKVGRLTSRALDAGEAMRTLVLHGIFRESGAMFIGGAPPHIVATRDVARRLRYVLTGTKPDEGN